MAEKFENFYIDHMPRQQNAHADALASLAASLALPSGSTERVLIYSRDLNCCKFALEDSKTPRDLQSKRFFRLRQVSNLGIGDSLISTSSYMAYSLAISKRQLPLEGKLLDCIIMRSCKHCITDRIMESYFDSFHTKRRRKHSKKLMTVFVELTNLGPSSETSLKDLAIIGRRLLLVEGRHRLC